MYFNLKKIFKIEIEIREEFLLADSKSAAGLRILTSYWLVGFSEFFSIDIHILLLMLVSGNLKDMPSELGKF